MVGSQSTRQRFVRWRTTDTILVNGGACILSILKSCPVVAATLIAQCGSPPHVVEWAMPSLEPPALGRPATQYRSRILSPLSADFRIASHTTAFR